MAVPSGWGVSELLWSGAGADRPAYVWQTIPVDPGGARAAAAAPAARSPRDTFAPPAEFPPAGAGRRRNRDRETASRFGRRLRSRGATSPSRGSPPALAAWETFPWGGDQWTVNSDNRFNGFHQHSPAPRQAAQSHGSAGTIFTSYFGIRSTVSCPSAL